MKTVELRYREADALYKRFDKLNSKVLQQQPEGISKLSKNIKTKDSHRKPTKKCAI
jgi:hypothetical protein